jgi:hypothetical protein
MMFNKLVAIPMAGAILSTAWVSAQDTENRAQPRPAKPEQVQPQSEVNVENDRSGLTQDRAAWNNSDQAMASCVTIQNQEEVALATMVQDKLQNEESKKFAEMLVEEHQAYLTKLKKFAPEAAGQQLDRGEQPSQVQNTTSRKPAGVERAAGTTNDGKQKIQQTAGTEAERTTTSSKHVDMLQIQREIAQECLKAAKAELQSKQGIEADQCFLGHQIAKHAAMKAQLTVFARHATPELAEIFAEGAATAEKHKNEAEDIMKSLASADTPSERRTQRKETREDRRQDK